MNETTCRRIVRERSEGPRRVGRAGHRGEAMSQAHIRCSEAGRHICQKPSGRECIEAGCSEAAGTLWGPLWCPEHDKERLDRVGAQLAALLAPASGETGEAGQ